MEMSQLLSFLPQDLQISNMTKRTTRQQSRHNNEVERIAKYYENNGYNVKADIKGFDKPITINGRRPDVIAKKDNDKVIVEVETKDSLELDKGQQKTFKNYADSHDNTRFRKVIA